MIFRLKTMEGAPEVVEDGIALFRDVVSGCCVDVDGFQAGYYLVDRESGRMITLTVWDGTAALNEGMANLVAKLDADPEVAALVQRVNANGVRFDTYELAHEIGPRG